MRCLLFIHLLIFVFPSPGFADLYPAQFKIPKIGKAPKLDGKFEKGEWKQCQEISDFVFWTLDRYEKDRITVYLGFDEDNLYVAFYSVFSDPEGWERAFEKKKPLDSIHLMAGPSLSIADFKNGDMSWNGDWELATNVHSGHWIAEIKIPFTDLGLNNPPVEEWWDLTLGRTLGSVGTVVE